MVQPHSRSQELAYDAPLSVADSDLLSSQMFDPVSARARHHQNAQEASLITIGPMPPRMFLDCFFAATPFEPSPRMLSSTNAFRSVPRHAPSDSDVRGLLVSRLW